jgi:hypothetical protein
VFSCTLPLTSALDGGGWSTPSPGRFRLLRLGVLLLKSFNLLAAFHQELLQAILYCRISVISSVPAGRFIPGKETWYRLYMRLDVPPCRS